MSSRCPFVTIFMSAVCTYWRCGPRDTRWPTLSITYLTNTQEIRRNLPPGLDLPERTLGFKYFGAQINVSGGAEKLTFPLFPSFSGLIPPRFLPLIPPSVRVQTWAWQLLKRPAEQLPIHSRSPLVSHLLFALLFPTRALGCLLISAR